MSCPGTHVLDLRSFADSISPILFSVSPIVFHRDSFNPHVLFVRYTGDVTIANVSELLHLTMFMMLTYSTTTLVQ